MTRTLFDAGNSAVISPCGKYRYRLTRDGPGDGKTVVIMVNPSTADAEQDDATIRKLRGFGQRHGWGWIVVGNLFAYRATDVRELAAALDPVGEMNDYHLTLMMERADRVIVAWGPIGKQPKALRDRYQAVIKLAGHYRQTLYSIGEPAKDGHPKHPLMLPYSLQLQPWPSPSPARSEG